MLTDSPGAPSADPARLAYPLLALSSRQGVTEVYRDAEGLRTATSPALKRGWFDNLLLIDPEGQSYLVEGARTAGSAGPFWGLSLMHSRRVRVALEIRAAERLSLATVKEKLAEVMAAGRDYWDSIHGLEDLERRIDDCATLSELIEILSEA
jgi:hypothetical protein